jgi:hypothetical protein
MMMIGEEKRDEVLIFLLFELERAVTEIERSLGSLTVPQPPLRDSHTFATNIHIVGAYRGISVWVPLSLSARVCFEI